MNDISLIFTNKVLVSAVLSWFISQTLKVVITLFATRKIDFRRFVSAGGMPSGHSASMMALTASVGLSQGWGSPMFAISAAIAMVIMYDAAGIRRAAGKQATALNRIVAHMTKETTIEEKMKILPEDLKELLGHTPIQVIAGAALGITVALLVGY